MVFTHSSYRTYLKSVLADRIQRNPSYSLRAMAGHLGCSHSTFSEVLRGKANFSQNSMRRIALTLGLQTEETEYLCLLNQLEATVDPEARASILKRLRSLNPRNEEIIDFNVDRFKQVADWYHPAIFALLGVKGFRFTPQNIARKLKISLLETEVALDRMVRLKVLEKDERGNYRGVAEHFRTESPVPNEALKISYRQMLEKIRGALDEQAPDERLSGFETLAFTKAALPKARAILDECFSRIIELSREGQSQDEVYHLAIHFINLTSESRRRPS